MKKILFWSGGIVGYALLAGIVCKYAVFGEAVESRNPAANELDDLWGDFGKHVEGRWVVDGDTRCLLVKSNRMAQLSVGCHKI